MTDFERAAKNAFKVAFSDTKQSGCLFHLGQCFWRKIQQLSEISKNYIADPDYAFKLGAAHPTLWKFIETVKKHQSLNEFQMEQHLAGETSQPPRKKYRDLSERASC